MLPTQAKPQGFSGVHLTQSNADIPDELDSYDSIGLPVDVGQRDGEGGVAEICVLKSRTYLTK